MLVQNSVLFLASRGGLPALPQSLQLASLGGSLMLKQFECIQV